MTDKAAIKYWRAFSLKKQSAFGTKLSDGDLTKCFTMEGTDFFKVKPVYESDQAEVGKGHEFATRQDLARFEGSGGWKNKLTSVVAGWLGAFGMGDVVSARLQKVGAVTFAGTGKETMTAQGTVTPGSTPKSFVVEIEAGGATFQWSNDGGSTQEATGVAITGAAQALEDGVTVTFADLTGYTEGDTFSFATTNTTAYQHTFLLQDPADGLQLPVTSIVENDGAGAKSLIRDVAVDSFELSGSMAERLAFTASLVSSGYKEDSTLAQPSLDTGSYLWNHGAQLQLGEAGSLVDVSSRVKDWKVGIKNALAAAGGRFPGCGLYAGALQFGEKREASLAITLKAAGVTEITALEANTLLKAVITVTGALIEAPHNHSLAITFEQVKYRAVEKGKDGAGNITYALDCEPLYYSAFQGTVKMVVVNDVASYLS